MISNGNQHTLSQLANPTQTKEDCANGVSGINGAHWHFSSAHSAYRANKASIADRF